MYLKAKEIKSLKKEDNQNNNSILKIKFNNLLQLFKTKDLTTSKKNFKPKNRDSRKILTNSFLIISLINKIIQQKLYETLFIFTKNIRFLNLRNYYSYYLLKLQYVFKLFLEDSIFKFLEEKKFKDFKTNSFKLDKNLEKISNFSFLNQIFNNKKLLSSFQSFSLSENYLFFYSKTKNLFGSEQNIIKNEKRTNLQKFIVNDNHEFFHFYLLIVNIYFLKLKNNSLIPNFFKNLTELSKKKLSELNNVLKMFSILLLKIGMNCKNGKKIFLYFLKKSLKDFSFYSEFQKLNNNHEVMVVDKIAYKIFKYPVSTKFNKNNNFRKLSNQFQFFTFLTTIYVNQRNMEANNRFSKIFFEFLVKKIFKSSSLITTNYKNFFRNLNIKSVKDKLFFNSFYCYVKDFFRCFLNNSFFDLFKKTLFYKLTHRNFSVKKFQKFLSNMVKFFYLNKNLYFQKIHFYLNKNYFKYFSFDTFPNSKIQSWLLILKQTSKSPIFFTNFFNFFNQFSGKNSIQTETLIWNSSKIEKIKKNQLTSKIPIYNKNLTLFLFSNMNSLCQLNLLQLNNYLFKLKKCIKNNSSQSQEILIKVLSEKVYSWSYYNSGIHIFLKNFYYCDYRLYALLWKWAYRRHSNKSQYWIQHKYFYKLNNQVWLFGNSSLNSTNLIYLPFHGEILMHLSKCQTF